MRRDVVQEELRLRAEEVAALRRAAERLVPADRLGQAREDADRLGREVVRLQAELADAGRLRSEAEVSVEAVPVGGEWSPPRRALHRPSGMGVSDTVYSDH